MNTKNYPKGSEWRKWDLHIHTPYTKLNNGYGNQDDVWDKFCDKIEQSDISVFGITDYFSIDTYFTFTEKFKQKYPSSNKVFFPNIEFRIDSKNSQDEHIQIHVIFSNSIGKQKLTEFLTRLKLISTDNINLTSKFCTSNDLREVTYEKAMVTIDELKKQLDINFASDQFLIVGVANGYGSLRPGRTDGRGPEYAKEIDKKCHAFFGKTENIYFYLNKIEGRSQYNLPPKPVLLGSDSHSFSDIEQRTTQYFTWIKADPTFEGLKQITYEPEERVFIGDEPDILKRVRENKTKFIKSIKINQKNGYQEEQGVWFKNIEIHLNPGLVAIIGNKGNGKSALTDIISLCGNSHLYSDFSFLKEDRFLKKGLAENFKAELIWESDESNEGIKKSLNEKTDRNSPERVRYLPQNYFERLTNNLETYDFEKTLENVVFSYIPEDQRLGKSSFAELIEYKKQVSDKDINKLRDKISDLNKKIIELESKLHPEYRKQIEEKLKLKKQELEKHEKPQEVPDPSKDVNISEDLKTKQDELLKLNDELNELKKQKDDKQIELNETTKALQELIIIQNEINDFRVQLEEYCNHNSEKFKKYGLDITQILVFRINDTPIKHKRQEIENKIRNLKSILLTIDEINKLPENERQNAEQNSLVVQLREKEKEIKTIASQLSEPQKNYQKYLEDLKKWNAKKSEIEGNEDTPDTIKWFEKELNYIDKDLRNDLIKLREERARLSLQVFNKKREIISIYTNFKNAVDERMNQFQNILGQYEIGIDTTLKIKSDFYDEYLRFINQRVRGSFQGEYEGRATLEKLIRDKDINTEDGIRSLLSDFIVYLEKDKRDSFNNETRQIKDQILKVERWSDFYDYIFSLGYLEPIYELKLGNKNLSQLSPGEKGALLIVFYLLLDKENIPLIIDQPEENLDNESVYKILSHFIREVKKKRQVIIVTHNPNLAIVGDAEQIIFVKIDKKSNNAFSFESGSIENPYINKHASDILEGTLKAFDIRRLKYLKVD